ncbi:MAG: class I tRNA ligase family protein, partial [Firmicutes bacterium]|nr:class I tRNA ligase family protein [Bacillota bacterium]
MEYGKTLNLPNTDFPMRGNLPQKEPETLKKWQEMDIYKLVGEKNAGKPKFILHDGPPYANGEIHLGHALNKVLKDIIIKYKTMTGYDSPYVPGWDTHGLPIEQKTIKDLGINRHSVSKVEFRNRCRDYALKYVDIQREGFKRLGVIGDWEKPYLTLQPKFEAAQIGAFGEMAKKGYIYKGLKPVYWCPSCETALAEAEVEYADHVSPAIYVKFPVQDGKGVIDQDAYV